MNLYESFDFSEGVIEVAKIAFSLERASGRILLTEFGGIFSAGFFPGVFFFLGQGENTPGKNPAETHSMKIQVILGEIPVCKNVGKFLQNIGSCRIACKLEKSACYPILKIQP